jgi:membrane-associated protease RseP (regulator of RpoE activity)
VATWLLGIFGLALLVFLHELGHFSVARLLGMKPRAFYIGFPPALFAERDRVRDRGGPAGRLRAHSRHAPSVGE